MPDDSFAKRSRVPTKNSPSTDPGLDVTADDQPNDRLDPNDESTLPRASAETEKTHSASTAETSTDLPEIPGYVVSKEIARGGMGRVLAARDLTLDREVAIKVLLPTAAEDAVARFVTESKITARLPHPNIPPVHAMGNATDGGPFLAMKLVRGKTLAELLRSRSNLAAELARWVGVFEQICQAVGLAHSQGILHRDLKPANVMVGAFGEVHVMDWGLAKETNLTKAESPSPSISPTQVDEETQQALSETATMPSATEAGQVMGTPPYMAPEQARGEIVDARADVFALGCILSVILTGKPVFAGESVLAVLRQAQAGNVDSALQRLASCGADAELVDLAKRCLAPTRDERPADGLKVAEAVAAYRVGVEARLQQAQADKAAANARAAEQQKRRRLLAVSAAIVIGVLLTGGVAAGWQWARAETALQQVTREQRKTETALVDLTASRDRNVRNLRRVTKELFPDLIVRKEDLSDSDRSFIRGLLPMWQEVAAARGNTPEATKLRAESNFSVASIQNNLGQPAAAEQAYRDALAAYEQLHDDTADAEAQQAIARIHTNLGGVLADLGQLKSALKEDRAALALQEQLVAAFPNDPEYLQDLARSHLNIGSRLSDQGDDQAAAEECQIGLDLLTSLTKQDPDTLVYNADLAGAHLNLGNHFLRLGKPQRTLEHYRTGTSLYEELMVQYPRHADFRSKLGVIHMNMGSILLKQGQLPQARSECQQSVELFEALVTEFPGVPEYRNDLASVLSNLAVVLAATKQANEAEKHYRRGLEVLTEMLDQSPELPKTRALLASNHDNLGLLLVKKRDGTTEAEQNHLAARELWADLRAEFPDHPQYRSNAADCHNHYGMLLSKLERPTEAAEEFRQALAIWEEMVSDFPERFEYQRSLAGGCCNIANLFVNLGELEEGERYFDKAIELLEGMTRDNPTNARTRTFLRNSYWSRAALYDQKGLLEAAATDWKRAIKLSPPQEQILLRAKRADSRARAGLAAEAVKELDAIAELLPWPASNRYNFACTYAVASDQANDDEQQAAFAAKAVATLRQAVNSGWTDVQHIKADTDLDPLRNRKDFQLLLKELEAGSKSSE